MKNLIFNTAHAQDGRNATQVELLNQIVPAGRLNQSEPFSLILNQIFYVGLVVAVALAVLMIVRGGIQYMTTDSIDGKGGAKLRIQAALGGLVLAFASILILNTINPSLTRTSLDIDPVNINAGLAPGLEGNPNSVSSGTRPNSNGVTPEGVVYVDSQGRVVIGEGPAHLDTDGSPGTYKVQKDPNGSIVINGERYSSVGPTPLANAQSNSGRWVGVKTDSSGNPIINPDGTLIPVLSWGNGTVNGDTTPFVALSSAQLAAARAANPNFKLGDNVLLTANGKTIQAVYADNAGNRPTSYSEFSPAAAAALGLNYRVEAGRTNFVEGNVTITLPD